jgi:hypothetical protein
MARHVFANQLRRSAHGRYHGGNERQHEVRHEQRLAHCLDAIACHVGARRRGAHPGPLRDTKHALARRIRQMKSGADAFVVTPLGAPDGSSHPCARGVVGTKIL